MLWGLLQTQDCLVGGNPAQFRDGNVCKESISDKDLPLQELNEMGTRRVGLVRDMIPYNYEHAVIIFPSHALCQVIKMSVFTSGIE